MIRFPDWQHRLNKYLHMIHKTPLVYGEMDCALFAAGGVLAMTGYDLAKKYRGRYSTLGGGLRLIRRDGYSDHADIVRQQCELQHAAFARTGDIAIIKDPNGSSADGPGLGILQQDMLYVLHKSDGLAIVHRDVHKVVEFRKV